MNKRAGNWQDELIVLEWRGFGTRITTNGNRESRWLVNSNNLEVGRVITKPTSLVYIPSLHGHLPIFHYSQLLILYVNRFYATEIFQVFVFGRLAAIKAINLNTSNVKRLLKN